jgi:exodeoxyribonuclease-3
MLSIISWNVNGFRAVLKNGFADFLGKYDPDILCLQETKIDDQSRQALDYEPPADYHCFWQGAEKKGYSGVALWSKHEPNNVSLSGVEEIDAEGRLLIAEFRDFTLLNGYFPNSQGERKRLPYKLDYFEAINNICAKLIKKKQPVIVTGDFNVAHEPIDLAHPETNENSAGYYIEEREAFGHFLKQGFIDTFRVFHPETVAYSYWSYRTRARARNVGWRLDYFCTTPDLQESIPKSVMLDQVMGSDHCPILLQLN